MLYVLRELARFDVTARLFGRHVGVPLSLRFFECFAHVGLNLGRQLDEFGARSRGHHHLKLVTDRRAAHKRTPA